MKIGVTRPLTQIGIFLLFFIVPLLDIFRMDLTELRFYVFRKSFSFTEGYILLLCVLLLVFFFVGISKWFGRQFCGWMCPHNTFSVYITKITGSKTLKQNPGLRKTVDIALSLLFAPIIAFSMVAYFFDPITLFQEIITLQWKSWSVGAYILLVLFFFLMIFRLRSNFCRSACPYGMFQMILSDKQSRSGGIQNMFRGTGLVLLLIVAGITGLLSYSILTTSGFSVTIDKKIQGAASGEYVTYAYGLHIQNNQNYPVNYQITYEGIPSTWEVNVPPSMTVPPAGTGEQTMVFRIDPSSLNKNFSISIKVQSDETHVIDKKLNILPLRSQ